MSPILKRIIGIAVFVATLVASISTPCIILNNYLNAQDSLREDYEYESNAGNFVYLDGSNKTLDIFIQADEHCTVTGKNPVKAAVGGTVSFDVIFEENYTFAGSDDITYKSGKIIIENCTESKTYNISSVKEKDYYSLSLDSGAGGKVSVLEGGDTIANGQTVSVVATPNVDKKLVCWTVGASLEDGGTPVSYEKTYSFTASRDLKLYANYCSVGSFVTRYNLGEGIYARNEGSHWLVEEYKQNDLGSFNLRPDLGDFTREGYNVLGYRTRSDGGNYLNFGALTSTPSSTNLLEVYAYWLEYSPIGDFTYDINGGDVTVKSYKGNARTLSIPAYIDGMPVTSIAADAIVNKGFEELVIPSTVIRVEDGAFKGCNSARVVYFSDNATDIRDSAFENCKGFTTVNLNATGYAYFTNSTSQLLKRYRELLGRRVDEKSVVFFGGDGLLYGLDCEWLDSLFNGKYTAYNVGGLSNCGSDMALRAMSGILQSSDIIVQAAELTDTTAKTVITYKDIADFEGCYSLISALDMSSYSGLFTAVSELNSLGRVGKTAVSYQTANSTLLSPCCDVAIAREDSMINGNLGYSIPANLITEDYVGALVANNNTAKASGIKYYIGFSPIFSYNAGGELHNAVELDALKSALTESTELKVIVSPSELTFTANYFYDTLTHLNLAGAKTYSNLIYNALMDAMGNSDQKVIYHSFDYRNANSSMGIVDSSRSVGQVLDNQRINLSANALSGYKFIGYTKDATAVDGGEFVSHEPEYTFMIKSDITLYANFVEEKYFMIRYFLDGGTTDDGVSQLQTVLIDKNIRPCVNLIGDTGKFIKDGYTLIEYNTEADGTGTAINPGGLTTVPKSDVLDVYAVWSKWSSVDLFSYQLASGAVTITSYKGDEDILSIPEMINGAPVRTIAANAVSAKSFHTLVLPRTVQTLADRAFVECINFDTLYICDQIRSAKKASFYNCKAFSNLRLNAAQMPCYSKNAESIATRWEQILTRDPSKPMMILVGGSSSLYGYNTPHLQQLLVDSGYDIRVVNAGTNAGGTGMLYIEGLSAFMQAGDYIVNAPEFYNIQMGQFVIQWRTFRATEHCYNLYRYVDFSKYTNFFEALSEFNTDTGARAGRTTTIYETKNTSLTDTYCDLPKTREYQNKLWDKGFNITASGFNDTLISNLNLIIGIVQSRGINYYYSSAPVYELNGSGKPHAENLGTINEYYNKAVSRLNAPVISHPKDYIFEREVYFDSIYHLISTAAIDRSERVYRDLIKQFALEGK